MSHLDTLRAIAALVADDLKVDRADEGGYVAASPRVTAGAGATGLARWLLDQLEIAVSFAAAERDRAEAVGELEGREHARAAHVEAKRRLAEGHRLADEGGLR